MKTRTVIGVFLSILATGLLLLAVGCGHHSHHHGGGASPPSPAPNPAAYTYSPELVAEHRPGFFSCCRHGGRLFLGTYEERNGSGTTCQLCVLNGRKVDVVRKLDGESIYNLYSFEDYMILPVEKGHLWRYNPSTGQFNVIHTKHLFMGHYTFAWTDSGWVTTEMPWETGSQLWLGNKLILNERSMRFKHIGVIGNDVYLCAYDINGHYEGGLLKVNVVTGEKSFVVRQNGMRAYGLTVYKGNIYWSLRRADGSSVIYCNNKPLQEIPRLVWKIKAVNSILCLTVAEHGWRKGGPCYLYVFDTMKRQFVRKLTFPDAEPWDISGDGNILYLVTRNEGGNIGRVYKITVK